MIGIHKRLERFTRGWMACLLRPSREVIISGFSAWSRADAILPATRQMIKIECLIMFDSYLRLGVKAFGSTGGDLTKLVSIFSNADFSTSFSMTSRRAQR